MLEECLRSCVSTIIVIRSSVTVIIIKGTKQNEIEEEADSYT